MRRIYTLGPTKQSRLPMRSAKSNSRSLSGMKARSMVGTRLIATKHMYAIVAVQCVQISINVEHLAIAMHKFRTRLIAESMLPRKQQKFARDCCISTVPEF